MAGMREGEGGGGRDEEGEEGRGGQRRGWRGTGRGGDGRGGGWGWVTLAVLGEARGEWDEGGEARRAPPLPRPPHPQSFKKTNLVNSVTGNVELARRFMVFPNFLRL